MVQLGEEGNAAVDPSPFHHQYINDTGSGFKKLVGDGADDDPGKEMGKVKHGLCDLFKTGKTEFIQHRETDGQVQDIEDDGVFQRPKEILIPENLCEGFQPDPFAAVITLGRLIVVENHAQTRIGTVIEQNDQRDRNQQQQIQMPVPLQGFFPGSPFPEGRSFHLFRIHTLFLP